MSRTLNSDGHAPRWSVPLLAGKEKSHSWRFSFSESRRMIQPGAKIVVVRRNTAETFDDGAWIEPPETFDAIRYRMETGGYSQADLGRPPGSRQRTSDTRRSAPLS
jgi:hypothetical protein